MSGFWLGTTGLWFGSAGLWAGFTGTSAEGGLGGGGGSFPGASLYLDMLSGSLDSRVTFTRSSTATFVGSNGLIQSSAIDAPRFEYNPVTLAPLGLLIEEQRTNLVLYSAAFNDATWTVEAGSVTANSAVSPDGTSTADLYVPDATPSVLHRVRQSATTTAVAHTISVFAKGGGYSKLGIREGSVTGAYATFNLSGAGSVIEQGSGGTATVVAVGNGWYRATVSFTASVSARIDCYALPDSYSSGDPVGYLFSGDGVSGVLLWGAQIEAGAFATSYIPTVASQVTRTADIATMTGTNFSTWYNASEGTFFASFEASPNTFTTYVAASNGVVAQNSMHMDNDGAGNMRAAYYSGSVAVALLGLGAVGTIGAVNKMASAYKVNDFAASRNGGAVVTDTLGAVPVGVVQLNIGADPSGTAVNVSNTHIRQIAYFKDRLTNAQLQALTA